MKTFLTVLGLAAPALAQDVTIPAADGLDFVGLRDNPIEITPRDLVVSPCAEVSYWIRADPVPLMPD